MSSTPNSISRRRHRKRNSADEARKRIKSTINSEKSSGPAGALSPKRNKRTIGKSPNKVINGDSLCSSELCPKRLTCAVNCNEKCSTDVTRWYHITPGEHYCNLCHEHILKSGRSENESYIQWKGRWCEATRHEPSVRTFVADELLPFWLECVDCGKWRDMDTEFSMPVDCTHYMATFNCKLWDTKAKHPCKAPQHQSVLGMIECDNGQWFYSLGVPLMLQRSPVLYFLHDYYYNDEIGQSAVHGLIAMDHRDSELEQVLQPFHIPGQVPTACCVRPDVQEYDEIVQFPEYASERSMYLGIRNLIIAMWAINPTIWLTWECCAQRVVCRGLIRIHAVRLVQPVWRFLTAHGVINAGVVQAPNLPPIVSNSPKKNGQCYDVCVVGAGIAGLSAARQLRNHGLKVCVLEARASVGGRMHDDWSLGVAFGMGAQLITGIVNNPIVLCCYQTGTRYRSLNDECPLLDAVTGTTADVLVDKRVDFHFNCILDAIADFKLKHPDAPDSSLHGLMGLIADQMMQIHNLLLTQSNMKWTPEEERMFQWQLGNVEFSCGAELKMVSAKHWDQNEQFTQFAGEHALLCEGAQSFLNALQHGIDVKCSTTVRCVDYSADGPVVISTATNKYTANKVLLTVPLAVLQYENIRFVPALHAIKRKSINSLGAGIIEKVAVRFAHNFWTEHVKSADYFGHVPEDAARRGLFNIFYDLSNKSSVSVDSAGQSPSSSNGSDQSTSSHVLMSYVCGQSVNLVNELSDAALVDLFVDTLTNMFGGKAIATPIGHVVTRWRRDPSFGMSYSFVRVGSDGSTYDNIASTIDDTVYFGGEATNRFFPQTMTGAYLSGVREASKIIACIHKQNKDSDQD